MNARRWERVTRERPCPACGKPDWCAWTPDGGLKCERAAQAPAGMVLVRRADGGALFRPVGGSGNGRAVSGSAHVTSGPTPACKCAWAQEVRRMTAAITSEQKTGLSRSLGVGAEALAISTRLLWDKTAAGEIPCVHIGRAVRYDPRDLKAWIDAQKAVRR